MAKNLILGVDPGFLGALAIYDPSQGKLVDLIDMPTMRYRDKTHVDMKALASWLSIWASQLKLAVIEEVNAMPGNGTSSSFRFGYYAGVVVGMIFENDIPMFMVKPAVWKAILGLSHDKALSFERANQLLPHDKNRWLRKKDDGRAEAALLAVIGEKWIS